MTITLALVFGALVGVLLGLLGGGGSILAVPVLVYAIGVDLRQAVPISLIVVGVAAAFGAAPKVRANQVQWRLATVFAVVGIPATFVGSTIGRHLPDMAIMIGFAAVMVAAGIRMLRDTGDTGTACKVGNEGINWRHCAPRSIPAAFGVGLLTGLFGVGGGFLLIPALVLMLGVEMPIAVGTSLLIIAANSGGGVVANLNNANINWSVTSAFVASAITGSLIAGQLGTRIDTARLRHYFAYLVFAVAAYVAVDTAFLY